MWPARLPMTPEMFVPSVVKAATSASVTSATAIAYSESSSPVSSRRKLVNMCAAPDAADGGAPVGFACERARPASGRGGAALVNEAGEVVDDAGDVRAERREDADDSQRDPRRGHRVLGKLQPGFVPKKALNHGCVCSFFLKVVCLAKPSPPSLLTQERGGRTPETFLQTETQRRSLTRAATPRGDRLSSRRLPARAACVEHLDSGGEACERQQQKVLPRVRRQLDGAQADEDREGEEGRGQCDGGEREEHFCGHLFHHCLLLLLWIR